LFKAESEKERDEWVNKTKFHAALPPSMQLLSYDTHKASLDEVKIEPVSPFSC
jgi:hypothetical protein